MSTRRDARLVRLERVAAKQAGTVTIEQLYRIGFSFAEVRGLRDRGHLHPLYRGVYAVGHGRLGRRGWLFAALLFVGDDAFLGYWTGAGVRGLCGINTWNVHVTVARGKTRKQPGLIVHRTKNPPHPSEVTEVDGLRVATVPLILIQLAAVASREQLDRMIELAIRRGSLRMDEMEAALERHAGERGVARLKQAVKAYRQRPFDKSGLEKAVAAAIGRDPRFPKPKRNCPQLAGGILWELDFFFEKERVALEVDGGQYHLTPQDRERDRLKDAKLLVEGIVPMRITDVRWELDAQGALDDLLAVLGLARGPIRGG